jgi:iron complex outermembrane receptor protein
MTTIKANGHSSSASIQRAVTAVLVAAAVASTAHAQTTVPAAGATTGLEEIVVTATRRESNLQSTPIAVTAIDPQTMAELTPRTLADVALLVPNFSANKINGFNAASFAMRGVGNTDIIVYNEAPVAVLIDDFVMPSTQTQLLDPFDVQEVEVLRGPQGTLFGKNTTGGAVVVKTKAPVLDQFTMDAQGGGGSYNEYNGQAAVNIPIIPNQLALRIVGSEEHQDGWMRNGASDSIGGVTYTGNGNRVGGTDVFTGRAKLLWQPMDNLRVLATYEMLTDRSGTPGAVNVTPTDAAPGAAIPYFDFALLGLPGYKGNNPLGNAGVDNRSGYLIDEQNGHRVDAGGEHLNIDYTIDSGTFTWVQGYRAQDSSLPSDYTGVVPTAARPGRRSCASPRSSSETGISSAVRSISTTTPNFAWPRCSVSTTCSECRRRPDFRPAATTTIPRCSATPRPRSPRPCTVRPTTSSPMRLR